MPAINQVANNGVLRAIQSLKDLTTTEKSPATSHTETDRYEPHRAVNVEVYAKPPKATAEKKNVDENGKKDIKDLEGAEFRKEVALKKEEIRQDILQRTKDLLFKTFTENPEFVEDIKNGKVPEYFNKENTTKRILDIYLNHFQDGQDRNDFVDRAAGLISLAYGDVETINGGSLPGLVNETRGLIFDKLEEFRNGASIQDIYDSLLKTSETEESHMEDAV